MLKGLLRGNLKRDLVLFFIVSGFIGFAAGITESVINNFYASYDMTPVLRGWLELPRELPGLLLVIISGVLVFMGNVRMAVLANIFAAAGLFGLSYMSPTYGTMAFSLFIYSTGIHLFMPLNASIGMSLAEEGKTGRRLGQLSGVTIAAGVLGSFLVWAGFRYLNLNFRVSFLIAMFLIASAAVLLMRMHPGKPDSPKFKFVFNKRYYLFYSLFAIYGARKQIFITFAPWLLIKVYNQPVEMFAILGIIGSIAGILFLPLLGSAIDYFGEKKVVMAESVVFLMVCIGYGFIGDKGFESWGLYLILACFIIDRLLMSAGMARVTYLKKIILNDQDLTPTISMGISIDHIVSMLTPVLGGFIWELFGYQYVFVAGMLVAIIYMFAGSLIQINYNDKDHIVSI